MPLRNDQLDPLPRYGWRFGRQHQLAILFAVAIATGVIALLYTPAPVAPDLPSQQHPEFVVDINLAGPGELVAIPGVGPSLAAAIVDYRDKHGRFKSLDSLTDVPGIGAKTLQRLNRFLLPIDSLAPTPDPNDSGQAKTL